MLPTSIVLFGLLCLLLLARLPSAVGFQDRLEQVRAGLSELVQTHEKLVSEGKEAEAEELKANLLSLVSFL